MTKRIASASLIAAALFLAACSDESGARKALEAQGYKEIVTTGYALWGCGRDDQYHTGFRAIGVNGQPVAGVVCRGNFKGSTVRMD